MKKVIALLLTCCLMAGVLAGCSSRTSIVEDYKDLNDEMAAISDYTFDMDMSMGFSSSVGSLISNTTEMTFSMAGTVSMDREQMAFTMYTFEDGEKREFTDVIFVGNEMYMNMETMYIYLFDMMGYLDYVDVGEMLGGYEYMVADLSLEDSDDDENLFSVTSDLTYDLTDEVLERSLTREDDTFTLTLEGADMLTLMDDLFDAMLDDSDETGAGNYMTWMMNAYGVELTEDIIKEMEDLSVDSDLSDYSFVSVFSYDEETDTYSESVVYDMPGLMSMEITGTYVAGDVGPVTIPDNAITEEEMAALGVVDDDLEDDDDWVEDDDDEDDDEDEDYPVAEEPDWANYTTESGASISLHGFESAGEGLELYTFEDDEEGMGPFTVLVLAGEEPMDYYTVLYSYTENIFLSYYFVEDAQQADGAADVLTEAMSEQWDYYVDDGSNFRYTPVYTNDGDTAAVTGMVFTDVDYGEAAVFYLMEIVDDGANCILVELSLFLDDATEDENAVFAQLGEQFGVDFFALIDEAAAL